MRGAANVQRRDGFDQDRWNEIKHETAAWRLLLQLDSDDTLAAMWGDAGTLYWAAREDTLTARAWNDVWFNFQCS